MIFKFRSCCYLAALENVLHDTPEHLCSRYIPVCIFIISSAVPLSCSCQSGGYSGIGGGVMIKLVGSLANLSFRSDLDRLKTGYFNQQAVGLV